MIQVLCCNAEITHTFKLLSKKKIKILTLLQINVSMSITLLWHNNEYKLEVATNFMCVCVSVIVCIFKS